MPAGQSSFGGQNPVCILVPEDRIIAQIKLVQQAHAKPGNGVCLVAGQGGGKRNPVGFQNAKRHRDNHSIRRHTVPARIVDLNAITAIAQRFGVPIQGNLRLCREAGKDLQIASGKQRDRAVIVAIIVIGAHVYIRNLCAKTLFDFSHFRQPIRHVPIPHKPPIAVPNSVVVRIRNARLNAQRLCPLGQRVVGHSVNPAGPQIKNRAHAVIAPDAPADPRARLQHCDAMP